MANTILSTILAKASMSILDQTNAQTVLSNVKVKKVVIQLTSEPMRHMLEDGSTIVDVRIFKPIHVTAEILAPDAGTIDAVNQIVTNRESRYQVTSRGVIVANLVVDSDAITQSAEAISATPIRLSFKQLLIEGVSPIVFAGAPNSSVIDRGIAIVNQAATNVSDLFTKVAKSF